LAESAASNTPRWSELTSASPESSAGASAAPNAISSPSNLSAARLAVAFAASFHGSVPGCARLILPSKRGVF
jgi:hypothetical protein